MLRHLAAIVVVLFVNAEPLFAQGLQLNVTAATADIHKFPSIGSPVIGKVTRGTSLEVTREIGHWVRVWWAGGEGSAGYMHVTTGSITRGGADSVALSNGLTPQATAAAASPQQSGLPLATPGSPDAALAPSPAPAVSTQILLPTHVMGLGAGLNMNTSNRVFKGTARGWWTNRFGVQFEIARDEASSVLAAQRTTLLEFAPSVLYSLPDAAGSYLWLRPYIGGGATFYRSSFGETTNPATRVTNSGMDFQAFGGGEFTLPSAPRFALSADLAYRRPRTSFFGFDTRTLNFSLSGHWYIK
jgi:hypothetical protein